MKPKAGSTTAPKASSKAAPKASGEGVPKTVPDDFLKIRGTHSGSLWQRTVGLRQASGIAPPTSSSRGRCGSS